MRKKISQLVIPAIALCSVSGIADAHSENFILASNKTKESSEVKNLVSDSTITAAINAKFLADPDIKSLGISATTVNGVVRLTGTVPNLAMNDRAISVAKETSGVKEVISELEIKPSSKAANLISDSSITSKIKAKYLADADIKALDVHVETTNGMVTLTGNVPNDYVKNHAISLAKDVEGVKEVKSKLAISPAPKS
jgi:hyperosmotically inducible protein